MQIINVDDGPFDNDRLAVFLDDHLFFQQGVSFDGIANAIAVIDRYFCFLIGVHLPSDSNLIRFPGQGCLILHKLIGCFMGRLVWMVKAWGLLPKRKFNTSFIYMKLWYL
jgi:hypothetical protein